MNYPKTLSILEVAKALNCNAATVCRRVGLVPRTGTEQIAFSAVADAVKCTPQTLHEAHIGSERLLTKEQAAAMLGLLPHSLNLFHVSRPTIVPVAWLGHGKGGGHRYSRKAVEAHLTKLAPVVVRAPDYAHNVKRAIKRECYKLRLESVS